jgi:putative transposase
MVTPDGKREALAHVCAKHGVSQRRACEVLSVDRSSMRYRSIRSDDADIREAMKLVASERRRFGYRRIHVMLDRQGMVMNPEEASASLSGRKADRPQTWRAQAGLGNETTFGAALATQRALEPRLRQRRLHGWSPLSGLGCCRRLHPRMPGAGRRHVALRSAARTGTRCRHRPPRKATNDCFRHWHGDDEHRRSRMVPSQPSRMALHRARQADAERLRGKLQCSFRDECLNETLFSSLTQARTKPPEIGVLRLCMQSGRYTRLR